MTRAQLGFRKQASPSPNSLGVCEPVARLGAVVHLGRPRPSAASATLSALSTAALGPVPFRRPQRAPAKAKQVLLGKVLSAGECAHLGKLVLLLLLLRTFG